MINRDNHYTSVLARDFIDKLGIALWVYDIDLMRVAWANDAALDLWHAPSLEELRSRDLSVDMSPAVDQRLRQYKEDFERDPDSMFSELWTLYPDGNPRTTRVKYRGIRMEDGRMAMLCEGVEETLSTPEALRSSEALLHTTVMISLLDVDGRVLYCNPTARARYGSSTIDMSERFENPEDTEEMFAKIAETRMCQMTVRVKTIHGLRWHDVHAFACHDAATGKRAILLSETDVTEMHEARDALEASRNEALEATRLKSEFLANMSHEIRTPLNGVLGMAQLLEQTELTEQQRRYTETVQTSGASLLAIIDDVLDISRIEAGLARVEDEAFDVVEVIDQTMQTVMGVVIKKGLEITRHVDLPGDSSYIGDARRVKQILINLAGNAVKFTEDGGIAIHARKAARGGLRFEVRDTGPGIPTDQQATIFERFRQADGSNIRKHGGTGLGLAISSSLVELMGGRIGVESEPGEGASFWFEIPLRPCRRGQTNGVDSSLLDLSSPEEEPRHKQVLLVEDNSVNQFLVMEALRPRGYDVTLAENGREAIHALDQAPYDLVIMDLQMPVMSGEEAIEVIRQSDAAYANVPILVFTANAMASAHEECMALGADDYLTKPVDIRKLLDKVDQHI
ncbi:MAG: ATP-binding protein [Pseudomonadota bacterium]